METVFSNSIKRAVSMLLVFALLLSIGDFSFVATAFAEETQTQSELMNENGEETETEADNTVTLISEQYPMALSETDYVASVGSQYFTSIKAALDYISANSAYTAMVTLLKDVTEDIRIDCKKTVEIVMDGHTINGDIVIIYPSDVKFNNGSINGKVTVGNLAKLECTDTAVSFIENQGRLIVNNSGSDTVHLSGANKRNAYMLLASGSYDISDFAVTAKITAQEAVHFYGRNPAGLVTPDEGCCISVKENCWLIEKLSEESRIILDGVGFSGIKEAFEYAAANEMYTPDNPAVMTVQINSTPNITDALTVPENKSFVLDINRNSIQCDSEADIAVLGSLEVKKGSINNIGYLTLHNGGVLNLTELNAAAVDIVNNGGTVNYNGGVIGKLSQSGGSTVITAGTVNNIENTAGELSINGGIVKKLSNSGTVEISSGVFEISNANDFINNGTINVSGGKFAFDPTAKVTILNGCIAEKKSDGYWHIVSPKLTLKFNDEAERSFASLSAAVEYVETAYQYKTGTVTFTLFGNISEPNDIFLANKLNYVFELGGNTLSAYIQTDNELSLTIKNGTLKKREGAPSNAYGLNIGSTAKLVLDSVQAEKIMIAAGSEGNSFVNSGVTEITNNGKLTAEGCTFKNITNNKAQTKLIDCTVNDSTATISNYAQLEISGGSILASSVINYANATIIFTGDGLTVNADISNKGSGVITVNGGTFKKKINIAGKSGVMNITAGTFDGTITNSGTVNISGGRFKTVPANAVIPEGKIFEKDGDYYVLVNDGIVRIADSYFRTLNDAVDYARTLSGTVEMYALKDIGLGDDPFVFPDGSDIVFKLDGYVISGYAIEVAQDASLVFDGGTLDTNMRVSGSLELLGGVESRNTIHIDPGAEMIITDARTNQILNQGSLTLKAGSAESIVNESEADTAVLTVDGSKDTLSIYSIVNNSGGRTELKGGSVTRIDNTNHAQGAFAINGATVIKVFNNGSLTINDARLDEIDNNQDGVLTVNGGFVGGVNNNTGATAGITGGTVGSVLNNTDAAAVNISGGSFGAIPENVTIPDGKMFMPGEDGLYRLTEVLVTIDSRGFSTLEAAISFAKTVNGQAVMHVQRDFDITETTTFPAGTNCVLDLNNHSVGGRVYVVVLGRLEITNGSFGSPAASGAMLNTVYVGENGALTLSESLTVRNGYKVENHGTLVSSAKLEAIENAAGTANILGGTLRSFTNRAEAAVSGGEISVVNNYGTVNAEAGTIIRLNNNSVSGFSGTVSVGTVKNAAGADTVISGGSIAALENFGSAALNGGTLDTLENRGTLNITDGVCKALSVAADADAVVSGGSVQSANNGGTVTINGGTVEQFNNAGALSIANGSVSVTNTADGTLSVSGGNITLVSNGEAEINGGVFASADFSAAVKLNTIFNGTFESFVNTAENAANAAVMGGKFKNNPSGLCTVTEGNEFKISAGYYVLKEHQSIAVYHGNGVMFAGSFAKAFELMNDSGRYVFKLLEDINAYEAQTVTTGQTVELNLGGHTVTGVENLITVADGAKLIVTDSGTLTGGTYQILVNGEIELKKGSLNAGINATGKLTSAADSQISVGGAVCLAETAECEIRGGSFLGAFSGAKPYDITGGIFGTDINSIIANSDYAAIPFTDSEGAQRWKVAYAPVALVSGAAEKRYENLTDAFAAAAEGDTVKLLKSYAVGSDESRIEAAQTYILDLNGKSITGKLNVSGADGSIINGTAENICALGSSLSTENLTVSGTVEVKASMGGTKAELVIRSGSYKTVQGGVAAAVSVLDGQIDNLNCFSAAATNISGGTVSTTAMLGNAVISGGIFNCALELNGDSTISGGEFHSAELSSNKISRTHIKGGKFFFPQDYDWTALKLTFEENHYPVYLSDSPAHWEIQLVEDMTVIELTRGETVHTFDTVEAAFADVQPGDSFKFVKPTAFDTGVSIEAQNVTIDLNNLALRYKGAGTAFEVKAEGFVLKNGTLNIEQSYTYGVRASDADVELNLAISGGKIAVYGENSNVRILGGSYNAMNNAVYVTGGSLKVVPDAASPEVASIYCLEDFLGSLETVTAAYAQLGETFDASRATWIEDFNIGDGITEQENTDLGAVFDEYISKILSVRRSTRASAAAVSFGLTSGSVGDVIVMNGSSANVISHAAVNGGVDYSKTAAKALRTVANEGKDLDISDCVFDNGNSSAIDIDGASTDVSIDNSSIYSQESGLNIEGSNNEISLSNTDIHNGSLADISGDSNIISGQVNYQGGEKPMFDGEGSGNTMNFPKESGPSTFSDVAEFASDKLVDSSATLWGSITGAFANLGAWLTGAGTLSIGGAGAGIFAGTMIGLGLGISEYFWSYGHKHDNEHHDPQPDPTAKPEPEPTATPPAPVYMVGEKPYFDGELDAAVAMAQLTSLPVLMLRPNGIAEVAVNSGEVVINLQGNTLRLASLLNNGILTITAGSITDGVISSHGIAASDEEHLAVGAAAINFVAVNVDANVEITGGTATVEGGTFNRGFVVSAAKAVINGGTFTNNNTVKDAPMILNAGADVLINEGSFIGGDKIPAIRQVPGSFLKIFGGTINGDIAGSGLPLSLRTAFFPDGQHPGSLIGGDTVISGGIFNNSKVGGLILDSEEAAAITLEGIEVLSYAFIADLLSNANNSNGRESNDLNTVAFNAGKFTGIIIAPTTNVVCAGNAFGKGTYCLAGIMTGAIDGLPPLFFLPSTVVPGMKDNDYVKWEDIDTQGIHRVSGIGIAVVDAAFAASAIFGFQTPLPFPKLFDVEGVGTPAQFNSFFLSVIDTITRSHVYWLTAGPAQVDESYKIFTTLKIYGKDEEIKTDEQTVTNPLLEFYETETNHYTKLPQTEEEANELFQVLMNYSGSNFLEQDTANKNSFGIVSGSYPDGGITEATAHIADVSVFGTGYASSVGESFTIWAKDTLEDGSKFVRFEDASGSEISGDIQHDEVNAVSYMTLSAVSCSQNGHYVAAYREDTYVAELIHGENSAQYESFNEALQNAVSGDTIKLLDDCSIAEETLSEINNGMKLTVDFNSFTLSTAENDNSRFVVEGSESELKFIDNSEAKTGKFIAAAFDDESKASSRARLSADNSGMIITDVDIDASAVSSIIDIKDSGYWTVDEGADIDAKSHLRNYSLTRWESAIHRVSISSGVYDHEIADWACADGLRPKQLENGRWTVEPRHLTLALYSTTSNLAHQGIANLVGGGEYYDKDTAHVEAPAVENYRFVGWRMASVSNNRVTRLGTLITAAPDFDYTIGTKNLCLAAVYELEPTPASLTVDIRHNCAVHTNENSLQAYVTVNGEKQQTEYQTYEGFKVGDKVTLRFVSADGVYLSAWLNGSDKLLGSDDSYTFTMASDTLIKVDVSDDPIAKNHAYVEFVSAYGQIMQSVLANAEEDLARQLPSVPSKLGGINGIWSVDGVERDPWQSVTWNEILSLIKDLPGNKNHIVVRAIYKKDPTMCSVTVYEDGTPRDSVPVYSIGAPVVVTAKKIEDKKFDHWASDAEGNNVLSYLESYGFMISGDMVLYAIYKADDGERNTVIPVLAVTNTRIDAANVKLSFDVTRSIPDGFELLEHGVVYTKNAETAQPDKLLVDAENVTKRISTDMNTSGTVSLNFKISDATKDLVLHVRGFAIVKNKATGEIETYYSGIDSKCYNNFTGVN